jgi:hypothetical protein
VPRQINGENAGMAIQGPKDPGPPRPGAPRETVKEEDWGSGPTAHLPQMHRGRKMRSIHAFAVPGLPTRHPEDGRYGTGLGREIPSRGRNDHLQAT